MASFDLTRMTTVEVPQLWEQRQAIFQQHEVDLAQTTAVDSSGIAFLVQWAKSTPEHKLKVYHAPATVQALIKTFHFEPLFVLA